MRATGHSAARTGGDGGTGGADTEVAVVGGGPVGTLLARELALLGVDVTVLERLPKPDGVSKAGTLHARTAQTLDRRGLLEAVQPGRYTAARGTRGPARFHFASIFELDLSRVLDEGPAIVGSPQAFAQEVFAADAVRLGARLMRDAELVGLDEEGHKEEGYKEGEKGEGEGDGRVRLRLRSVSGAERTLTARWVVGADGARSAVRRLSGIRFLGDGPTVAALMGEVRLLDPAGAPGGWQRTPRGWTLLWVDPHGTSRVCTYDYRGPHRDRHSPVTLDELRGEVERIAGRPVPMDRPDWIARFSDASLQAERYRKGRILLAGDAAHVHFPAGGQGVNLGLQDAVNLGWKLAAEIHGWAPDGLLDTYHAERHPVAAAVLHNVKAQVALMDPDPRTDALRELFTELMRFDEVNAYLSTMITGTGVTYPVGGRADDPLAGRMVPSLPLKTAEGPTSLAELLHDARPLLLDLTGDTALRTVAAPWAGRVTVVTATPAAGSWHTDAVLVRPDGYALWSARADRRDTGSLRTALTRWFGPAGS
ncbi:FAD-dependent monooxygenase [Streptomyces geranii]|uniref:FAD-dependent monooxygenase n=1 Tax=Streptomyces geranii TaxID=2058923 RepID=UPI000D040F02|nr:FAD-dependent monooxygenase [Streptomyces geranii]